jgi:hypothetical protein
MAQMIESTPAYTPRDFASALKHDAPEGGHVRIIGTLAGLPVDVDAVRVRVGAFNNWVLLCPNCRARRRALYRADDTIACRVCLTLGYTSSRLARDKAYRQARPFMRDRRAGARRREQACLLRKDPLEIACGPIDDIQLRMGSSAAYWINLTPAPADS